MILVTAFIVATLALTVLSSGAFLVFLMKRDEVVS